MRVHKEKTLHFAVPVGTALDRLTPAQEARLFERGRAEDEHVAAVVAALIADVRARGDVALHEQAARFDGVADLRIEVPRPEWDAALARVPVMLRRALEEAASNITAFHRAQLPADLSLEVQPGVILGRRADPLDRVAVYAPGGRAAYPSSVLMGVVPARVAGVREVVVLSPAGTHGAPPEIVLAACALAGADRVFAIGGAGAVAAAAFGTATVPRADRVVGPGNAYVAEAKRQLGGIVGTDSPAGPSEVLVLADDSADARLVASELLAQAEHDPDAAAVLVSTSEALIGAVRAAIVAELPAQARRDVIAASFAAHGALLRADDVDGMLEFVCRYAPEHLALHVRDARSHAARARNAGTIFIGATASVAFGDYITGANHVLPTAGRARSYSGLSVLDCLRFTTLQEVTPAAAARLAPLTAVLAEAEGLPAHARAARLRVESV